MFLDRIMVTEVEGLELGGKGLKLVDGEEMMSKGIRAGWEERELYGI